ncbi:hypothetical protein [Pseudarthrobacter enclensis]|uniref:Transposase n=1 Tax=Pseudarthrobacter enclensis TaxID=993070 RepID=A0ABT9RSB5_9MICC|nr:hypothetical protein [Pseudarthrobacter enclensis]MDP9887666.1 hypothetical protein [Pseudarthrobacter enclensis]
MALRGLAEHFQTAIEKATERIFTKLLADTMNSSRLRLALQKGGRGEANSSEHA